MKFICLTVLLFSGITDSRLEQYEVVGAADPVLAVAGEDVILPCSVKLKTSVVDMRVEWYRSDLSGALVHLYEDHEDRNTEQIQSYRGRTKLNHQELQRGNASLKLSTVQISDEGSYKCLIKSRSWFDDAIVNIRVEAVGSPPVITVDGFDRSGGLHLQCESEGWIPEPDLEWLDSEGVSLSSETTETHRNTDGFSLKHTIIVYHSEKYHCRVKLRHHMLETLIITTSNMFNSWRTSVIMISVFVVLSVIAGLLIAVFVYKYKAHWLQNEKSKIQPVIRHLRTHTAAKVTLEPDSAHPRLIVSDYGKQVKLENTLHGNEDQNNDEYFCVLGKDGFSSGCFYYEVQVKDQTVWDLGVARESNKRKGPIRLSPNNGFWTVGQRQEIYRASYDSLSLTVKPQRVGVFVNYEKGLVSFYDVESMSHIHSFTGQSFIEKLYPFVSLGPLWNDNSTPLIICD